MSAAQPLIQLAGALRVRPGQRPALLGGRPALAGRLLRGQPMQAAVQRLPLLYSLCGQAHRLTAELAIRAASQGAAEPDAAARQALRAETRREHLRHILLDWPRLLAGETAAPTLPLRLEQNLDTWFDGSSEAWLQAWQADPRQALYDWSTHSSQASARLLRDCRERAEALRLPVRALPLEDASLQAIERGLGRRPDFALHPELDGKARETGTWTRARECTPERYACAWLRLGARLADLAALSLARPQALALGALALGPGLALAWSETARGLLLHRVQLDLDGAEPRILDYQVLAPTEWNLHPRGSLARALEALADDGTARRQAELLLAVYDPCLAYRLECSVPRRTEPLTNIPGAPRHA